MATIFFIGLVWFGLVCLGDVVLDFRGYVFALPETSTRIHFSNDPRGKSCRWKLMLGPYVHDAECLVFSGQKARKLTRLGDGCGVFMRVELNADI
jgi:hypothetical protein